MHAYVYLCVQLILYAFVLTRMLNISNNYINIYVCVSVCAHCACACVCVWMSMCVCVCVYVCFESVYCLYVSVYLYVHLCMF